VLIGFEMPGSLSPRRRPQNAPLVSKVHPSNFTSRLQKSLNQGAPCTWISNQFDQRGWCPNDLSNNELYKVHTRLSALLVPSDGGIRDRYDVSLERKSPCRTSLFSNVGN
jgi:hypothetical protein